MSHSPAQILNRYLIAAGALKLPTDPLAATDWPGQYGALPDAPDNAIAIYNTGGTHDGRIMRGGRVIEHPGVNIRVRAGGAGADATAYAKARSIANLLDAIQNAPVAIDGVNYTINAVSRPTPIIAMGQEEGGRRISYSINALLTVTEN
jgi:hypothetical protein